MKKKILGEKRHTWCDWEYMAVNPCKVEEFANVIKKEQEERHIWTPWEYKKKKLNVYTPTKYEQVRTCKRRNLSQGKRK